MYFAKKLNFYGIGLKPLFLTTHKRVRPGNNIIDALSFLPLSSRNKISLTSMTPRRVYYIIRTSHVLSPLRLSTDTLLSRTPSSVFFFFRQSCNLKTPSTTERTVSVYIDIAAPRFAFHSFFPQLF
jgi:hypothetical protein